MFIDLFAWIGWIYDLKTVPSHVVKNRVKRTGDGSHEAYDTNKSGDREIGQEKIVWGWGDADMSEKDYELAEVLNPALKNKLHCK